MRNIRDARGFTLIELLVVMGLMAVLVTLGAAAFRHYWFVRSLEGGTDEVVTQLKNLQQRAVAESNPVIYGAAFPDGESEWALLRYLPAVAGGPSGTCTLAGTRSLDSGVVIEDVAFSGVPGGLNLADARNACRPAAAGAVTGTIADDGFVFFLPRGTAVGGSVSLSHPRLDNGPTTVSITGLTSRIARS